MNRYKYLPNADYLKHEKFELFRLRDKPEFIEAFIKETTKIISNDYDDINLDFAKNIVQIDNSGFDQYGFFTLGKEIWVVLSIVDSSLIGFEVITRKRGGSIKLGPTILMEKHIRKGYAGQIIEVLIAEYKKMGVRKVYVTAPLDHIPTARLDFNRLDFKMEAILNLHYNQTKHERISGRILCHPKINKDPILSQIYDNSVSQEIKIIEGIKSDDNTPIYKFIIENMMINYSDIDDSYVDSLIGAQRENETNKFENKTKRIYTIFNNFSIVGLFAHTPKRGGILKVAPFLISSNFRTDEIIKRMLMTCVADAKKTKKRKILFCIPHLDWNIIYLLSKNGCIFEGVLKEPYKAGRDCILLSYFMNNYPYEFL